jgi:hypothetical protein
MLPYDRKVKKKLLTTSKIGLHSTSHAEKCGA